MNPNRSTKQWRYIWLAPSLTDVDGIITLLRQGGEEGGSIQALPRPRLAPKTS